MSIITDQQTFDALFVASRDPRLAALQDLKTADGRPDVAARTTGAVKLAQAGLIINEGIDINGMDPFFFMRWLASMGFVWYQALFQAAPASLLDYQDASKAWPSSIKISLDDGDYPAFAQPAPPQPDQSPVGTLSGVAGTYGINAQVFYKNGSPQYSEGQTAIASDGETVYAHYGPSGLWWGWAWETAAAKAARIAAGN